MDPSGDAVYCTLLLSDQYLPGAMVLAHSLRDNGTKAKLVALFTSETLQPATVDELRTVYDEVIPVRALVNGSPANLWLMERPDLVATFTKIELWRLTQYRRIVYLDCDVVALRAPDELLSLEADFAAVPDVGWPDCFNSGVMVLRPNLQDYYALKALAERGISFDGADQGLLNMHFRNWHRLSFTYNCTPSANYQYIPAYKHFQSTINLIHFIGSQKPWTLPRQIVPFESPYNQLLGRWWAVYDKHYRLPFVSISQPTALPGFSSSHSRAQGSQGPEPHRAQHAGGSGLPSIHLEGVLLHEEGPAVTHQLQTDTQGRHIEPQAEHYAGHQPGYHAGLAASVPMSSVVPQYVRGEEHVSTYISHLSRPSHEEHDKVPQTSHQLFDDQGHHAHHPQPVASTSQVSEQYQRPPPPHPEPRVFEAPKAEWDASREPPPVNSKPEGISLHHRTYTMSEDTHLFQPPPSYPAAPKNMYYQIPAAKPEPQKLTQLFPWESRAPKPTRVFADERPRPDVHKDASSPPANSSEPTFGLPHSQGKEELQASSWETYPHSNAWDEDPEIQRYIQSLQQTRRGKTEVISEPNQPGSISAVASSTTGAVVAPIPTRPSVKLTDFPTEVERPSLPVTPAPVRPFHDEGDDEDDEDTSTAAATLPAAEGVPSQEDWNPLARLEELRRHQSEVVEHSELLRSQLSTLSEDSGPRQDRRHHDG